MSGIREGGDWVMTTAWMAALGWLHAQRRWITPLLGVVAAASLAYSVEAVIIGGLVAAYEVGMLLLVGLGVSVLLAAIAAFDLFAARRYGVVLHVALLRDPAWRRRHEVEHELLVAHAQSRSSYAGTTTLTAADIGSGSGASAIAAEELLDSAATGAALLPGASDLRILAAGDTPSLIALGYAVQPALSGWRTQLLVDRSHEQGEAFADLAIPNPRSGGSDDRELLVLVGRVQRPPVDAYRASVGGRLRTVESAHIEEKPEAYERVLAGIADELGTTGSVTVGASGPAVFGFAAGWVAAAAGVRRLRPLKFDQNGQPPSYLLGPEPPLVAGEPVRRLPSLGVGRRLLFASSLLAALSTLAFGSFATFLEWTLAGSNADGPFTDWAWLVGAGIVLPGVLAWFVLRPRADRLSRPDVRVALQPTDEAGTRSELLVAPRTAKDSAYTCVGWLREAMADIRSFRPGSRVIIDLDSAPDWVLPSLGSYLNRGHRGGEVALRCGGVDNLLIGDDPAAPERVRRVREGYLNPLRDAKQWEFAS